MNPCRHRHKEYEGNGYDINGLIKGGEPFDILVPSQNTNTVRVSRAFETLAPIMSRKPLPSVQEIVATITVRKSAPITALLIMPNPAAQLSATPCLGETPGTASVLS